MMNMFQMPTLGISSFGGFGGFGSIFGGCNMFGGSSIFTNCDGTYNYDAMAGFGIANAFMQVGGMAINQALTNKRQTSQKALGADVESLNNQIDEKLNQLGKGVNESNYTQHTAKQESWYTSGIAEADKEIVDAKAIMDSITTIDADKATVESYSKNKADLQTQIKNTTDDAQKAQLEAQLRTLEENFNTANDNVKKYNDAEKNIKAANDKKAALDKKADKGQEKIDNIIADISDLIYDRDEIQNEIDDKKLAKADGNKYNRVSIEELNDKFDEKTGKAKEDSSFTKRDFYRAVTEYKTAGDDEKAKWKNRIIEIYNNMPSEEKNRNIIEAYAAVK